ncbi:hypothetical protein ACFL2A_06165, partial [Thermodesulfobacteriota bacterium]
IIGLFLPIAKISHNKDTILRRYLELQGEPPGIIDSKDIGMPGIGNALIDDEQKNRLIAINEVLNHFLTEDETYLDMTNRNAHYYYFNRRIPIETGAFYNLVGNKQQIRAVNKLMTDPPPVVLINADTIKNDGVSLAYRSYALYRFIMMNYVPIRVNGYDFMVLPDRLNEMIGYYKLNESKSNDVGMNILDASFKMPYLQSIPESWGRSFSELSKEMTAVAKIDTFSAINDLDFSDPGFTITGEDPYILNNISHLNIDGKEAGLLAFDLQYDNLLLNPTIEIYWDSEEFSGLSESNVVRFKGYSGKIIVPLDTFPRWFLGKKINNLRIDIVRAGAPEKFTLNNIQLYKRNIADITSKFTKQTKYPDNKYSIENNSLVIDNLLTPADINDENWKNGIAVNQKSGYSLTINDVLNINAGDKLLFASGAKRSVIATKKNGNYTNILVDGKPLDPIEDGYPNRFLIKGNDTNDE